MAERYIRLSGSAEGHQTTTATSDPLDSASVFQLDIHFFFPFSIDERVRNLSQSWEPLSEEKCAKFEERCGNDNHLIFSQCKRTYAIESDDSGTNVTSGGGRKIKRRVTQVTQSEGMHALKSLTETGNLRLTANGDAFELANVYVREFGFHVGMLRFSIRALNAVSLQTVLNLQNQVMRLSSTKEKSLIRSDGTPFNAQKYIHVVLDNHYGVGSWHADSSTDRLFVYTVAAISNTPDHQARLRAAYAIGQMEWNVPTHIDDDVIQEFQTTQLYLRFASTTTGGLWTSFHRDGGSTILFSSPEQNQHVTMFGEHAGESALIEGTTRPLAGLSMAECLLFQRTFLRDVDKRIHSLVTDVQHKSIGTHEQELKWVHSRLLYFRAEFNAKPVSRSSSCEKQFQQWALVAAIESTRDRLDEIVKDLHTYFGDISGAKTQSRLNALTIVLGFLGLAQLVNGIYVSYADSLEVERIWLQVVVAVILFFIAVGFFKFT